MFPLDIGVEVRRREVWPFHYLAIRPVDRQAVRTELGHVRPVDFAEGAVEVVAAFESEADEDVDEVRDGV